MIPGNINTDLISGADDTGYAISRSLRFNSSDSAYLSRTPASAGNRKTWTWAGWVKRSGLDVYQNLFCNLDASNNNGFSLVLEGGNRLHAYDYGSGAQLYALTLAVFRDVGAWYHVVFTFNSTAAIASDRARLYVNGAQQSLDTPTYPTQNADSLCNTAQLHAIGRQGNFASNYLSGYLADIHFIDGQALDPTSFGEFSATTGVWMPKAYSGSYGTNGFHLDFADNSAATATTLGKDAAGSNNWTPNNLIVASRSPVTYANTAFNPVFNNNYTDSLATVSGSPSAVTFTSNSPVGKTFTCVGEGIQIDGTGTYQKRVEFLIGGTWTTPAWVFGGSTSTVTYANNTQVDGIRISIASSSTATNYFTVDGAYISNVNTSAQIDSLVDVPTNGSEVDTGLGGQVRGNYCCWNPLDANSSLTISNGNLELTNTNSTARNVRGTIAFPTSGKWYYEITPGGSVQGAVGIGSSAVPLNVQNAASQVLYFEDGSKGVDASRTTYGASYSSGTVIGVAFDADLNQVTFYKNNVSQGAIGTTAGVQYFPFVMSFNATYVANFGQRPFAYTAPSGFKALCTANLPAPLVTKANQLFDTTLWNGNSSTQTITLPGGMSPDLVWLKARNGAGYWHMLYDTVRGSTKGLFSNETSAELTLANSLTSFNSDGFSLGSHNGANETGKSYVGWCWDAGSSTVTNTQGSITSQVRANASAGFSVVTYTGNGSSGATVGHGLGVAPRFLIGMDRTGGNWQVWGANMNNGSFDCVMNLNTTDALATGITTRFRAASSTTYTIGTDADINSNGNAYVTYCFAPVAGYSAMGSWQNNGSNDGTFVYLGFRPKFILLKNTDNVEGWYIMDSSRHTYNVPPADATKLQPNLSDAEGTGLANTATIDFLSNGFKIRTTNTASGEISFGTRNYIYAAFAESPFAANNRAR